MSYWRDAARRVIAKAIEEGKAQGLEGRALAQHVSKAYCFLGRSNHPYKIWCNEVQLQLHGETHAHKRKRLERGAAKETPLFDKPEEGI